jgi:PqqD family protein of HPr-rel-A system
MTRDRSRPRIRDGLLSEELGDEMLVFDERNGAVHALNPTAAWIFRNIDGQSDVEAISRSVARALEIDFETAARDVRQTLDNLDAKALLG